MRQAILVGLFALGRFVTACGGGVEAPSEDGPTSGVPRGDSPAAGADPSIPSAPTPQPLPCVGHPVMWTTAGGWPGRHASSTITSCRTYEHVYYPDGINGPAARCSAELKSAGSFTIDELTAAMDDKDVQSAFARGGEIGTMRSGADGVDDLVVLHGGNLTIGYGVPKALEHLVEVLRAIDEHECPMGR